MPFIVETGVGVPNANSLASVAQADGYCSLHLEGGDWVFLDPEVKQAALVMGTAVIADGVDWFGRRVSSLQTLPFPRYGIWDRDGFMWATSPIPRPVVEAVCELARILALRQAAGQSPTATSTSAAVEEIKVGSIELKMSTSEEASRAAALPRLLPSTVMMKLRQFGDIRADYGPRTRIRWD